MLFLDLPETALDSTSYSSCNYIL